ncbi:MAG: ATP-binding protein [Oscillospiraceae bacterium]|nr:ATP-binding protein [Oscillospiraceae bacterium]MDD7537449.1 ATP-binding protein [Oscillospiraceae bacterium]MDY5735518.1 ATP-binding protein [Oscillospiraceae bacterium]
MFRSLHIKLVMILLLLVTSLMAVVGAFLMTSVTSFYIDDFYAQMSETFGESNAAFVHTLRSEAAQEDGMQRIQAMIETYSGTLGIDGRNRNYYILDARTGAFLAGSDEGGETLEQTENILTARNGSVGDKSDIAANYMDVAIPISGGDNSFIIYIRDNRSTVSSLNSELLLIILQALLVGLLVSVTLSFLLAKTIIDPIEKLTEGTERIAKGDFNETLNVESTDEIGILTTTFNDMASVLHKTLEAVENERNKLDTLFLHMTDGVVAYDGNGALIHCNPAAAALLGRKSEDCRYSELFETMCPFAHVVSLQRSDFVESELAVGDRSVEVCLAPFSDEQRGGVLVVLHDVTEHRKTEERRKEFVANVSHELRTPLTNVRSYAETIREAGDELSRETENDFLDVVISETDRMTNIVRDLLTLSRLDSGRSEMNMARFPFGAAIDAVLRSIELEARRHHHELTRSYPDSLPIIVGDRGRLEQVMLNVLGNAVKYTPDGGHIHVTAGESSTGDKVWMEVADDGIGIPEADRSRIFERFYRVDKARSRESGGTGLGLSIATEIVQRHNGTLSLVDREGPGTTVRLELPIIQPLGGEAAHE